MERSSHSGEIKLCKNLVIFQMPPHQDSNQLKRKTLNSAPMTKIFDTIFNLWLLSHLTVVIYHWYIKYSKKYCHFAGLSRMLYKSKSQVNIDFVQQFVGKYLLHFIEEVLEIISIKKRVVERAEWL